MTPWTVAHQAPLSMGFSRQEHWRGLPFPPPGDLPDPGIEPVSWLAGGFFTSQPPGKPRNWSITLFNLFSVWSILWGNKGTVYCVQIWPGEAPGCRPVRPLPGRAARREARSPSTLTNQRSPQSACVCISLAFVVHEEMRCWTLLRCFLQFEAGERGLLITGSTQTK